MQSNISVQQVMELPANVYVHETDYAGFCALWVHTWGGRAGTSGNPPLPGTPASCNIKISLLQIREKQSKEILDKAK